MTSNLSVITKKPNLKYSGSQLVGCSPKIESQVCFDWENMTQTPRCVFNCRNRYSFEFNIKWTLITNQDMLYRLPLWATFSRFS